VSSSNSKKPTCVHCEIGRTLVVLSGGQRVHRYRESNGVDYDWYSSPCHKQTKRGMASLRREALGTVTQRIIEIRGKLAVLEANASRIKEATHPSNIELALERVKTL
jgi:hypothetical protein